MTDDYRTPMSILQYVLDKLRTDPAEEPPRRCKSAETPDDDPREWSPEDGGGYIPEEEGGPPFHEYFDTDSRLLDAPRRSLNRQQRVNHHSDKFVFHGHNDDWWYCPNCDMINARIWMSCRYCPTLKSGVSP